MAFSSLLNKTIKKIATLDFTSERKSMSTIITGYPGQNKNTLLLKGAPERVIEKCTSFKNSQGQI